MFISSKYEEIYPPSLSDFVYICDHTFSTCEILLMEKSIFIALDFDLSFSTSNRFLEQFFLMIGHETKTKFHCLCEYLISKALLDSESSTLYKPSLLAISALYLSKKLLKLQGSEISEFIKEQR